MIPSNELVTRKRAGLMISLRRHRLDHDRDLTATQRKQVPHEHEISRGEHEAEAKAAVHAQLEPWVLLASNKRIQRGAADRPFKERLRHPGDKGRAHHPDEAAVEQHECPDPTRAARLPLTGTWNRPNPRS